MGVYRLLIYLWYFSYCVIVCREGMIGFEQFIEEVWRGVGCVFSFSRDFRGFCILRVFFQIQCSENRGIFRLFLFRVFRIRILRLIIFFGLEFRYFSRCWVGFFIQKRDLVMVKIFLILLFQDVYESLIVRFSFFFRSVRN